MQPYSNSMKKKADYTNVPKMASLTLWQENVLAKLNKIYICWKLGSTDTDMGTGTIWAKNL